MPRLTGARALAAFLALSKPTAEIVSGFRGIAEPRDGLHRVDPAAIEDGHRPRGGLRHAPFFPRIRTISNCSKPSNGWALFTFKRKPTANLKWQAKCVDRQF